MATHRFIGDHHAAAPLSAVRRRRAVLGSGEVPETIRVLERARPFNLETQGNHRPEVHIASLDHAGHNVWRVATAPR